MSNENALTLKTEHAEFLIGETYVVFTVNILEKIECYNGTTLYLLSSIGFSDIHLRVI